MKRLFLAVAFCAAATPTFALFDTTAPGIVQIIGQYPLKSVPETISATGTTTAFTATLPVGTASQTVYICGVVIDAAATAGTVVPATITGTVSGTLNFLEYVSPIATPGQERAGPSLLIRASLPARPIPRLSSMRARRERPASHRSAPGDICFSGSGFARRAGWGVPMPL